MSPNRRAVLASGVLALSLGLAGCLGDNPGGESSPEELDLAAQLPAPEVFDRDELDEFRYYAFPALRKARLDWPTPMPYEIELHELNGMLDLAGLTFEDIAFLTKVSSAAVAHGEFHVEEVGEALESHGFELETEDDGLTIYSVVGENGTRGAVGLATDRMITVGASNIEEDRLWVQNAPEDPVAAVRAVYDMEAEESNRYVTSDAYIGALVNHLDGGMWGRGMRKHIQAQNAWPHRDGGGFAGQEAWGVSFDYAADHIEFTEVIVFGSDVTPPRDAIDERLEPINFHQWGVMNEDTEEYSVTIDDNVAIVDGIFHPQEGDPFRQ